MSKTHMGSSIDAFLKKEGIFEETQAQAIKEVVAWQLAEAAEEYGSPDIKVGLSPGGATRSYAI